MSTYVTPEGLEIPTVEDLLTSIGNNQRATIDPLLDTDPDSPQGQLNGIFASHLRDAWEVLGIAFNGLDPDQAEGSQLEDVSAITGTIREPASASIFDGLHKVKMTLQANKTIDIGTVFSQAGNPLVRFETTEEVVSSAPGDYLVACKCQTLGPVSCNAGTLTVIATPVTGLDAVTNDFDVQLGVIEDTDPLLRSRREQELRATGKGTIAALQADLLALKYLGENPILSCHVYENQSDVIDGNGLPPKSFEALVYDGVSAATPNNVIAQQIWDSKPGGIKPFGNASGIAVDTNGDQQVVFFSRPQLLEIILSFTISVTSKYAGNFAVQEAVKNRFTEMVKPSSVIRYNDYVSALIDDNGRGVSGVVDVNQAFIGVFGQGFQPVFTNLALGIRQMAFTQDVDITVNAISV